MPSTRKLTRRELFSRLGVMRKHPLKSWREAKGLSQNEAAAKIGVTKQCWQLWESGRRTPDGPHVRSLAKLTGVDPNTLYAAAS